MGLTNLVLSFIEKGNSVWTFKLANIIVNYRHKKKIANLSKKKVFRVCFLVNDLAKWKYDYLYRLFLSDSRFFPFICVTKPYLDPNSINNFEDIVSYFLKKNYTVELAYNAADDSYVDILKFGADIVFYEQPTRWAPIHHPSIVNSFAITCVASYGYNITTLIANNFNQFHKFIDYYFTEPEITPYLQEKYSSYIRKNQLKIIGSMHMDSYLYDIEWRKNHQKKYIIYAPHFSVDLKILPQSTFDYTYSIVLELAKKYSEQFVWIYKPHPFLKNYLIKHHIFSAIDYDIYVKEWKEIGKVYYGSDYIEFFKKSVCLITDSCAFLTEFLPSERPIFHLVNPKTPYAPFVLQRLSSYYNIFPNYSSLRKEFERVIIRGDDYKQNERIAYIDKVLDKDETASGKAFSFFNNLLFSK